MSLLNPLPYKNAKGLATPSVLADQDTIPRFPVPVFLDFKEENHTFEDVIGLRLAQVFTKQEYRSDGTIPRRLGDAKYF